MEKNKTLWNLVYNLWENGTSWEKKYKKLYDYYDGKLDKKLFTEDKTSDNIIEEIVETKVTATLDAPFTIQVVPSISPLKDLTEIDKHQIIADIFNEELHHVLKENNFDELKEQIVRFGEIMGFSAVQTFICDKNDREEIKIEYVNPENIRWDKGATKLQDISFIAYKEMLTPNIVKEKYCKNDDGSYNEELCKLVDKITTGISATGTTSATGNGKIVAYKTKEGGGLAFNTGATDGIQAGKTVELVVMYLVDTSVYSPSENDNIKTQELKKESVYRYPYGRMVTFALAENEKIIFEDIPAPKSFGTLANIDIFNTIQINKIEGKSEVEDLIPIQNRINGTLAKQSFLVSQNVNSIVAPDGIMDIEDDEVIEQTIIKVNKLNPDGSNPLFTIKNQMIDEAIKLESILQRYERQAYKKARLNETMVNGVRQIGTTSGEQVEQLNESPMASIRMIQKNLKNFIVDVGTKIVKLIQEYYTDTRYIEIATGLTVNNMAVKYAQLGINKDGQQIVSLFDKAMNLAQEIILDPDWEYKIEVVAGIEIPRSRKELSYLMEKIFTSGILNTNQDIDLLEMFLKSLDIPNYRAVIQLLRQKQQAQASQNVPIDLKSIFINPNLSKAFADIIKSLEGFSKAKGQILNSLGLDARPDTFNSAPVQSITSKSSATDIATIMPEKISNNPIEQEAGQQNAVENEIIKKGAKNV
ncbi:MAG: hypothetical protein K5622_07275 [Endomicrobiaceae bacterium]|nr:hypothetical protein [Endomicrobiaceae bacterium]